MTGKVYLVGAGPSDVGLLTLKAMALLQTADVVVHDALVGIEIMGLIPPGTRRIDVGKHAGSHPVPQEQINEILLREAMDGKRVVRLKGGDPFLFGRGGEELELLADHGIPFEIVPGVTSAVAVPAYAGIPVTHRDYASSVHIITGHTKRTPGAEIDFEALARLNGTLVFLMGVSSLTKICDGLLAAGMAPDMPAALLERGTTARQRSICGTLAALPRLAKEAGAHTPAIIVVGRVCALADRFCWADKRPLGGKRILVTRPRLAASRMAAALREKGAEVVELPAIEPEPIEPNAPLDAALASASDYAWLALTSPTGVRFLMEHLLRIGFDIRRLYGLKIAAIGSATAKELQSYGLCPDLVPEPYSAAALGRSLALKGGRVLIARARKGAPALTEALDAAGISYSDIALYDTRESRKRADAVAEMLNAGEIDYVAFTSASTVRGFVAQTAGCDYKKVRGVCIGQATEREARKYEIKTHTAREATIDAMMELMIDLCKGDS